MSHPEAFTPFRLQIVRRDGAVIVVVGGSVDEPARRQLAQVVSDLVEGQGNLFVAVEHTDGDDDALLELLRVLPHPTSSKVAVRAGDGAAPFPRQ